MPKDGGPSTAQGNPNHALQTPDRVARPGTATERIANLPNDRIAKPPPETFTPPNPSAEVDAAMKSQQAQRSGDLAFRDQLNGNREQREQLRHEQLNNVLAQQRNGNIPPPTPAPQVEVSEAERRAIHDRLEKNKTSGIETQEIKVDAKIAQAAAVVVNHLRSLSAQWNSQIEALKLERGLRDDQVALSLMAATLENGQHLLMPLDHPYFMNGFKGGGSNFECIICGQTQPRRVAGQNPFCAPPWNDGVVKRCAEKFRALPPEEQQELLALAS